jgi:hypothetical protein
MDSSRAVLDVLERVDRDPRRLLVERVLASEVLSRSERLCDLLRFVCDQTLAGHAEEINEQRVGEAVFGRPKDYDSSVDGIVRTQASRLRQRLRLYFDGEGCAELLIVSIPRGSYVPVFAPREQPREGTEAAQEPQDALSHPEREFRGAAAGWVPWTVSVVLLLACTFLALRARRVEAAREVVQHPIWDQMFQPDQSTLLLPGDSSLVNYQTLAHHDIGLDEYVAGDYRTVRPEQTEMSQKMVASIASRRYTSIVDLEIAQSLSLLAHERLSRVEIRYPREARPNDFKHGNLVLVGCHEANPWVWLFEPGMNFVFDELHTPGHLYMAVVNRAPRGAEPRRWMQGDAGGEDQVYAVVAFLPNLAGTGNVLILEGITMAGTECAWDFITDEKKLEPFLHSIRQPTGRIPHFEVVLGTRNINGSAGDTMVLASRVIDR